MPLEPLLYFSEFLGRVKGISDKEEKVCYLNTVLFLKILL